jgi:hypothetical protein
MNHDPGRLVHDQQVLVLERDPERHVLGLELTRVCVRRLEDELLPAREPVAFWFDLAVDERGLLGEQPFGRGARLDLRQRGEEPVEPLPGRLRGDDDPSRRQADLPLDSVRRRATNRIPTPITMKESARLNAGQ